MVPDPALEGWLGVHTGEAELVGKGGVHWGGRALGDSIPRSGKSTANSRRRWAWPLKATLSGWVVQNKGVTHLSLWSIFSG